jgi:hypothetical protein
LTLSLLNQATQAWIEQVFSRILSRAAPSLLPIGRDASPEERGQEPARPHHTERW